VQTTKVPGLDVAQIIDAEELVARMYDQIDLNACLQDAVDDADVAALADALARARDMGDTHLARYDAASALHADLAPSLAERVSCFLGFSK